MSASVCGTALSLLVRFADDSCCESQEAAGEGGGEEGGRVVEQPHVRLSSSRDAASVFLQLHRPVILHFVAVSLAWFVRRGRFPCEVASPDAAVQGGAAPELSDVQAIPVSIPPMIRSMYGAVDQDIEK